MTKDVLSNKTTIEQDAKQYIKVEQTVLDSHPACPNIYGHASSTIHETETCHKHCHKPTDNRMP